MKALTLKDALKIVQSLREGTPPRVRLIHHTHVGRQRWLEGMAWYLDNARNAELSAVRFIIGDYGSGKTHFLRMTAHMALQRRFVVCEVTLSREVRLDHFDTVWRTMMSNLATPQSDGEPEGIEAILNRWCEKVAQSNDQLQNALAELERIPNLDPDFRQALRGYLRAWFEEGDRDPYLQWFKGDSIRLLGVRTRINRASARAMLRSFILFLHHLGYSGLVLFLDELEQIPEQQSRKVRDANYDVLRQFIDDADNLKSFLLLCSATPIMLKNDIRGFPSYPALWQRIGGMLASVKGDYRAITVNLGEAQLTDDDLVEVAKRIRDIHAVANEWDPKKLGISDEFLSELVKAAKQRAPEFQIQMPRYVVQTTLSLLETKQQNPDESLEDLLPDTLNKVIETIRQQEQKRYRPWNKE